MEIPLSYRWQLNNSNENNIVYLKLGLKMLFNIVHKSHGEVQLFVKIEIKSCWVNTHHIYDILLILFALALSEFEENLILVFNWSI